jgi:hypothetical protein
MSNSNSNIRNLLIRNYGLDYRIGDIARFNSETITANNPRFVLKEETQTHFFII